MSDYGKEYKEASKQLSYAIIASFIMLTYSYLSCWTHIGTFIFYLIPFILIASFSIARAVCFFIYNEDVDNYGTVYSLRQKALIIGNAVIPALFFSLFVASIYHGDMEKENICKSKEYLSQDVCSKTLGDLFVVFKYSDSQVANAIKEVNERAAPIIAKKTSEQLLEDKLVEERLQRNLNERIEKEKREQELRTINVKIDLRDRLIPLP